MNNFEFPADEKTSRERRNEGVVPVSTSAAGVEAVLSMEMAQLEARVNARLAAQDRALAELQIAVNEAITGVRGQLSVISLKLSNAQAGFTAGSQASAEMESTAIRIAGDFHSQLQESIEHLSRRVAFLEQSGVGNGSQGEEFARLEDSLDRVRRDVRDLHENMAQDFQEFELNLKAQTTALDAARVAITQTDEL